MGRLPVAAFVKREPKLPVEIRVGRNQARRKAWLGLCHVTLALHGSPPRGAVLQSSATGATRGNGACGETNLRNMAKPALCLGRAT